MWRIVVFAGFIGVLVGLVALLHDVPLLVRSVPDDLTARLAALEMQATETERTLQELTAAVAALASVEERTYHVDGELRTTLVLVERALIDVTRDAAFTASVMESLHGEAAVTKAAARIELPPKRASVLPAEWGVAP